MLNTFLSTEVPRMLLALGRDVGQYVASSDDKVLFMADDEAFDYPRLF